MLYSVIPYNIFIYCGRFLSMKRIIIKEAHPIIIEVANRGLTFEGVQLRYRGCSWYRGCSGECSEDEEDAKTKV